MINDILIIGDTPSSYTASIYSKTANLSIKHLIPTTSIAYNLTGLDKYPGFYNKDNYNKDKKFALTDFFEQLKIQADGFKVEFLSFDNLKIKLEAEIFVVENNKEQYKTKSLIIEKNRHNIKFENGEEDERVKYILCEGEIVEVCADGCKKFLDLKHDLL